VPRARSWAANAAAVLKDHLDPLTADGGLPGGVITAGTADGIRHTVAAGIVAPECGPEPPDEHTRYDVASLTKVVATWPLVGRAVDRGLLDLDAPVRTYLPGIPAAAPGGVLTVRQILTHTTGLRADTHFEGYLDRRTPLAELICAEPLISAPGMEHRYIDRGFILLGLLLATVQGRELDLSAGELWRELGMTATLYGPVARAPDVAPTEPRLAGAPRLWGTVHDPSAALMGGIAGHAGVFSTTSDLASFAEHTLGSPWLAESMQPALSIEPGRHRGLAWIIAEDGAVAYHHGFTGTSLHLAPRTGRYLAICTNAVYHGWDRARLAPLRDLALSTIADGA